MTERVFKKTSNKDENRKSPTPSPVEDPDVAVPTPGGSRRACCSMPVILLNLAALHVFYISFFIFSAGTVRTIEKRFELRSTQTGLMNSVEDVVQTAVVIVPSYLGLRMHKLRLLSGFMAVTGAGILLTVIPYAIYGPKKLVPEDTSLRPGGTVNMTAAQEMALGLCVPDSDLASDLVGCESDYEINSNMVAYAIFLLTNALVGFGTSGTHALSTSYIDENTPSDQAPVYIGIFQASKGMSPVIGSFLAAAVLRIPENLKDSVVDVDSPNWIGAWWLGFAIIGSGIILMCVPLFFTPQHLPYYYSQQESPPPPNTTPYTPRTELQRATQWIKTHLKGFLRDLRRLMTNGAFLSITASYVCYLYLIVGIFLNLGRYMEIHFRLSPSFSNVTSGVSILSSSVGTVIGGFIMKRLKPSNATGAKIFTGACLVGALTTALLMFVPCQAVNVKGRRTEGSLLQDRVETESAANIRLDVNLGCARNCSCSAKFYRPVCVNGDVDYFSPCHAGCLSTGPNGTYSDCSCVVEDLSVRGGQCEGPCATLYIYVIIMCVGAFVSSLGKVPAIIVGLRVMPKDLKSLGLGIQTLLMNLLTFIPGPLIYGALFDSSCTVWSRSCGKSGNCLLYDTTRFRYMMHGPTAGFQLLAAVFAFLTYLKIRNDTVHQSSDDSDKEHYKKNNLSNDGTDSKNSPIIACTHL